MHIRRQERPSLNLEPLEKRWMLAVDFTAGALAVPAVNRADIPLGVVSTFNFDEPLLRVNPTDPGNIVVTSHNGIQVTNDASGTFTPGPTFPDVGIGNNGDTAMDFDSQGRLFWANLTGSFVHLQITQVDPTTGNQIGVTTDVNVAAGDPLVVFDDKEFLAADAFSGSPNSDNLYMVWTRFITDPDEVFFSRSTDQGTSWSPSQQLSNASVEGFPWPSDVAVAPNGDVYTAYHAQPVFNGTGSGGGNPDGVSGQTFVLRSTDGGVTFPQKVLAFGPGQSDITFNVQDSPGAIPGTRFWMQGAAQPWLLADPVRPGNIYVITNDDPDNTHGAGDDGDIVIARSTDNGINWTQTTIPDGAPGTHQLFPFASIDQFGNIAVAWYDTRRGLTNANGNSLLDVFASYSVDGGQNWAPAFMVNDPANPLDPDFPGRQGRADATEFRLRHLDPPEKRYHRRSVQGILPPCRPCLR